MNLHYKKEVSELQINLIKSYLREGKILSLYFLIINNTIMAKDINGRTVKLNDIVIYTYRGVAKLLKGKVIGFSPTDRPRIEYSPGNSYYTNSDLLIVD